MCYIRTLDVYSLSVSFNIPKCLILPFVHLSNTFCFCFCSKPSGPQSRSFLFSFYCIFRSSTFYHSCSTFRFFLTPFVFDRKRIQTAAVRSLWVKPTSSALWHWKRQEFSFLGTLRLPPATGRRSSTCPQTRPGTSSSPTLSPTCPRINP